MRETVFSLASILLATTDFFFDAAAASYSSDLHAPTVTTLKTSERRDGNSPRPQWPVIAVDDMTDFGRAAYVINAAGAA